jgi:hypothetical protein
MIEGCLRLLRNVSLLSSHILRHYCTCDINSLFGSFATYFYAYFSIGGCPLGNFIVFKAKLHILRHDSSSKETLEVFHGIVKDHMYKTRGPP